MPLTSVEAREIVHLVLLRELAKNGHEDSVIVKGGVNLRFFFESLRYSEDIDLDGESKLSGSIRSAIKAFFKNRDVTRTLQGLGVRGLDPGEGPNKDSDTTFRYKFGVLMPGDIRYPTKIEVSFRERYPGDQHLKDEPSKRVIEGRLNEKMNVRHYVREAAVRQKIDALGGRREAQARDVFDLCHLIVGQDSESLAQFVAAGLGQYRLTEARERTFTITLDEYRGQVVEFLEPAIQNEFSGADKWDELCLSAAEFIDQVIERSPT